jgi:hypothetical protein
MMPWWHKRPSMQVVLTRWADTPFGVFGTLTIGGWSCYTLEDDWKNNLPNESCIPAGSYLLRKVLHHGTLPTYEVYPVGGRSAIHIHPGNTEEDTQGCILLGKRLGALNVPDEDDPQHRNVNKWAVLDSQEAHAEMMIALGEGENDHIPIAIRWQVH